MTATVTEPRPPPSPAPDRSPERPPATRQGAPSRRPASLELAAAAALALVTLATVAGFVRLYRDGSFFPPLAVMAVTAHVLAAACRRARLSAAGTGAVAVVSGVLLSAWLFFPGDTSYGVPTLQTWDVALDALSEAWARFGTIVAPGPVLPGFQLAAAVAIWTAAWFADWSAFRLGAAAESVVPAGALFMFGSLLGARPHRAWATVGFGAAVLLFVLVHRLSRQEGGGSWLASEPRSGRRALFRSGAVLIAVAIGGGALLGPSVPGAGNRALLPYRPAPDEAGTRVTVSPLVDIQKRLVNQSDQEVFQVRSSQSSYWRLTSLDTFNGRIWSSGGSFTPAEGVLPRAGTGPPDGRAFNQTFSITGLAAIWAPTAFQALSVRPDDTELRWDTDSSTLIVSEDNRTSDNITYEVVSRAPRYDRDTLLRARDFPTPEIGRTYLRLPAGFQRSEAADLARSLTADRPTPYDKALALQNFFRSEFTYDLDMPAGHSADAITDFLRSRRGYCEQFAGTYAAMARAIGLPARVAVGFTPGLQDEADPALHRVFGRNAHAWPEVHLEDVGWVPFEPTPGRGAPGAERYTGVAPAQDATPPPAVPSAPAPGVTDPGTPRTLPRLPDSPSQLDTAEDVGDGSGDGALLSRPAGIAAAVAATAGASYLGLALAGPALRRRRRRRLATSAAQQVGLAWDDAVDPVVLLTGQAPERSETHRDYATRLAEPLGPLSLPHRELAELATAASWSEAEPDRRAVDRASVLGAEIRRAVHARIGPGQRLLRRLEPRQVGSVLTGRRASPDGRSERARESGPARRSPLVVRRSSGRP